MPQILTSRLSKAGPVHADPILSIESFIILCLLCIVHLHTGIVRKCSCIKFTFPYYSCYLYSYMLLLDVLCLLLENGRSRMVGLTRRYDPSFHTSGARKEFW
jgi:hypothetical protein